MNVQGDVSSGESEGIRPADIPGDWRSITRAARDAEISVVDQTGSEIGVLKSIPDTLSDSTDVERLYETDDGPEFETTFAAATQPVFLRSMSMTDVVMFVPKRSAPELQATEAPSDVTVGAAPAPVPETIDVAEIPETAGAIENISAGPADVEVEAAATVTEVKKKKEVPSLSLNPEPVSTSTITQKLSKNFLDENIGEESAFNALQIDKRGTPRGYLVKDSIVSPYIHTGILMNSNDLRQSFSDIEETDVRYRIGFRNKVSGYSYVSPDVFEKIKIDLLEKQAAAELADGSATVTEELDVQAAPVDSSPVTGGGIETDATVIEAESPIAASGDHDSPVEAMIRAASAFDHALKPLPIHDTPVEISFLADSLSIDFLEEELGPESGFIALPVEEEGTMIGCIMPNTSIPESFAEGTRVAGEVIQINPRQVLKGNDRTDIVFEGEPSGFSFVRGGLFIQIHEELVHQQVEDALRTSPDDAPSDAPVEDAAQDAVYVPTPYEFEERPDQTNQRWKLRIDNRVHYLGDAAKELAEVLLDTDTPLSKSTLVDEHDVDATTYAFKSLEQVGLLKTYKIPGERPNYYMAFTDSNPRSVDPKFVLHTPGEKKPTVTPRDGMFDDLDALGVQMPKDMRFKPPGRDYNGPAFPPSEFSRPERNPDPSLVDVPYIGLPAESERFAELLEDFERGNRADFARATLVDSSKATPDNKNGVFPGEGRWVYVGSQEFGEALEAEEERIVTHGAHNMIM